MLVLDWTVRILSIAAAGLIIGQAAVGDWTPYVTVMHPVFMTLGCVVFMSNGIVTYVSDYWIFSEEMKDRGNMRVVHGILQFSGATCLLAGYLTMFVANDNKHSSQIAQDAGHGPASRLVRAHVWLGYITLAGVLLQVFVGLFKFVLKARKPRSKWAQWHGIAGAITFTSGILAAIMACAFMWLGEGATTKQEAVGATAIVLLVLLLFVTAADLVLGPKPSTPPKHQSAYGGASGSLLSMDGMGGHGRAIN